MSERKKLQEEHGFFNNLGRERTQTPFQILSVSCLYENKTKDLIEKAVYETTFSLPQFVNEYSNEYTEIIKKEKEYPENVVSTKLLFHPREGDTIMFHIPNHNELVNEVLDSPQVTGENETCYFPQPFLVGESGQSNVYIPKTYKSARDILREAVRLEPIDQPLIECILKKAKGSDIASRIANIISSGGIRKIQYYYSISDFLRLFPKVEITIQDIINHQRRMGRRTYDIGYIDWEQKTISITVVLNAHHPQNPFNDSESKIRYGASASSLVALNPGSTLYGHIKRYPYALPERFIKNGEKKPIIIVAPGSAFGSVRPFLQERINKKRKGIEVGKVTLITGGQYYPTNILHKGDVKKAQKTGILESAHFAASRGVEQDSNSTFIVHANCYVSDVLWKNQDHVWNVLKQGGTILINGTQKMAEGVREVLKRIVQKNTNLLEQEVEVYLNSLVENFQLMEVTSGTVQDSVLFN